jgi:hypothetical protein
MSLELKIEALTAAIESLNRNICNGMLPILTRQSLQTINESSNVAAPAPVAPAPTPVVQAAPAPVAALVVDTPAPVAAAPAMPAPPTFAAPVAAPAATGAPFSDPKGLIDYVMGAYKALGPQKGAQIQGVLTGLGYQNINDVKPEHYAALHTGVEALKG